MQHIQGISRQQLRMSSLEDTISQDNPVRFIEAFVENISIVKLGFTAQTIKCEAKHAKTRRFVDSKKKIRASLLKFLKTIYDNSIVLTVCNRFRSTKVHCSSFRRNEPLAVSGCLSYILQLEP
jgi:hypothetical protein